MLINYTIPFSPITKKNHSNIISRMDENTGKKRSYIVPSSQFLSFQDKCGWFLKPLPEAPIDTPVNIKYSFYMDTMRVVDITNLFSAMDDILEHFEVIKNDNCKIVVGHDGSRVYYDKENPRVEIEITDTEPTFVKPELVKKK